MQLESAQKFSIVINSIVVLLAIAGSGILIWRLNFKDRNARLLFILYIFYWMAPLMCREYTGQMHLHMYEIHDNGTLLFVPLIVYGVVGIFWRPLNDVFSFKLKSRRNVIFLSLMIELCAILPFIIKPCFATNIIQSIGCGIGASAIGLFNLMFGEEYHSRKIFKTVSIIALPPLIAEVITSGIESLCTSFLQEGEAHRYDDYRSVMWYLWIIALVFILVGFILAFFIKARQAELYKENVHKEPVTNRYDWIVVILVCLCGSCALFVRWCTAGPTATSQLIYIGEERRDATTGLLKAVDTRFYEGYLSMLYAIGQLGGTALAGAWLTKSKSKDHIEKPIIISIASILWIIYLITNIWVVNVPVFFSTNLINGLAMGLVWPVLVSIMMHKYFTKSKYVTPMGAFNTFLSFGITTGTFCNNWLKGPVLDFESRLSKFGHEKHWNQFIEINEEVNFICICMICLFLIAFVVAYALHIKYPPKKVKIAKFAHTMHETEV